MKLFYRTLLSTVFIQGAFLGVAIAADVPQSFTLDGRLFSNPQGTTPLNDSTIGMRLQILDDAKLCVLYEEQQSISTAASEGYFTVQVGSQTGSTKRTVTGDSGNDMTEVFSNLAPISGKAVADGLPCIVSPVGGKRRFVRIIIAPSSLGGAERTLSPDLTIDSVPNALIAERAESIQGLRSSNLLQVNTAAGSVLTQSNLESLFSNTTRFNAVTSLVDGTSSTYMRSNSTTGAQLPVLAGAPMTPPTQGSIWYDSSDERLKFQSSGGPVTLTTGSAAISALTGDVTASGNGSVAATVAFVGGSTAANVNAATVLANASTDANTVSTIVRRDGTGGFSAGRVSTSATRLRDATVNYVELKAPAAATSYSITLPGAVGGTGQTLVTTDAAGTLGWTNAAVSSQWTTSGANIYFNTGSVGVGTASPATTLHILSSEGTWGGAIFENTSTSGVGTYSTLQNQRRVNSAGAGVGFGFGMYDADSTMSEYGYIGSMIETNTVGSQSGSLVFAPRLNNARAEAVRITSTGRMGIGTTDPPEKLSVVGNISIDGGNVNKAARVSVDQSTSILKLRQNNNGGTTDLDLQASTMARFNFDGNERYRVNSDGSVLIYNSQSQIGIAEPAVSAAGQGRIYFDSTSGKFRVSQNGGAYADLVQPPGATASGTAGKIAKFSGTSALADSLISDDGNQVTVASNLVSTPTALPTGATVNLRTSNTHILSDIGGSTITLQNPAHGGLYNIVVADTAVRTYTFNGCTNSYYKPARGPTINNTQTVYGILFVDAGAGTWNCYITWSTGFATP
ncbi:MAG: hypothetical protein U1E10_18085 [Bdellovibrionales bacterium]|nr:hypothetical protein [Bdellovibrionales bacterium]